MMVSVADARRKRSKYGKLKVESLTIGASIYVDGKKRGTVPLKKPISLRTGKYTVRVSHEGFADYIESFKIRRRRTTTLAIDLLPAMGILRVSTMPTDAQVILDGNILGRTPINEEIDPGTHQLELRKKGFKTHRQPLEMLAGDPMELDIQMQRAPPQAAGLAWYEKKWVWITAAGVATLGLTLALLASSDADSVPSGYLVRVDTVD